VLIPGSRPSRTVCSPSCSLFQTRPAGSAPRKSLNHRELKGKLRMGPLSLQAATRYKEPEPDSESSSDDDLFLKSEIRPGLRRAAAPPMRSSIFCSTCSNLCTAPPFHRAWAEARIPGQTTSRCRVCAKSPEVCGALLDGRQMLLFVSCFGREARVFLAFCRADPLCPHCRASINGGSPEKEDAGLLAKTSAQSPFLVSLEGECRVDHGVMATPAANRLVQADSSQQEMPRRTSKPPATPASPGQVRVG